MFEGLMLKVNIQLYTAVKGGTYKVRAVGSLDSETFFASQIVLVVSTIEKYSLATFQLG